MMTMMSVEKWRGRAGCKVVEVGTRLRKKIEIVPLNWQWSFILRNSIKCHLADYVHFDVFCRVSVNSINQLIEDTQSSLRSPQSSSGNRRYLAKWFSVSYCFSEKSLICNGELCLAIEYSILWEREVQKVNKSIFFQSWKISSTQNMV